MRTSAIVLIRSYLGVDSLKNNPHEYTMQPDKNTFIIIIGIHKIEGLKKTLEISIQKIMPLATSFFADLIEFIKNHINPILGKKLPMN